MNMIRRKKIEKIIEKLENLKDDVEEILSEEEDCFYNMPENMQGGEKGEVVENAIECIENARDGITESIEGLQGIIK